MHYTRDERFLQFIRYFHEAEDYFECHEVLEHLWKEQFAHTKQHPLPALILLSTALYHWRRENWAGALKLSIAAKRRIQSVPWDVPIDQRKLIQRVDEMIRLIRDHSSFRAIALPFTTHISWRDVPITHCPPERLVDKHRYVFQKTRAQS